MQPTDRSLIRDLAEAYFFGVDAVDRELIASCFHRQARVTLHAGTSLEQMIEGRDAIADRIFQGCRRFGASNHAASNMRIEGTQEEARLTIFAIAHVLTGGIMQVRGLRYDDRVVFDEGRWWVADRVHTPRWQYDVEATSPVLRVAGGGTVDRK